MRGSRSSLLAAIGLMGCMCVSTAQPHTGVWKTRMTLRSPPVPVPESWLTRTSWLRVTAYHDRGVTASGRWTKSGQCAAPSWVPFGSIVVVAGREYVVTDRTAKRFRRNTVDIWLPTHAECVKHGVKWQTVTIKRRGGI